MTCPATPENPCMCSCHTITVDDDFTGPRPMYGCSECENGEKLANKEGK